MLCLIQREGAQAAPVPRGLYKGPRRRRGLGEKKENQRRSAAVDGIAIGKLSLSSRLTPRSSCSAPLVTKCAGDGPARPILSWAFALWFRLMCVCFCLRPDKPAGLVRVKGWGLGSRRARRRRGRGDPGGGGQPARHPRSARGHRGPLRVFA